MFLTKDDPLLCYPHWYQIIDTIAKTVKDERFCMILCNCAIDQWGEKRRLWSADLLLIFLNLGISVKIGQRHSSSLGCTLSDLVAVKQSVIQFFVMMPQSPLVSTLYTLLVLTAGKADVYTCPYVTVFTSQSSWHGWCLIWPICQLRLPQMPTIQNYVQKNSE